MREQRHGLFNFKTWITATYGIAQCTEISKMETLSFLSGKYGKLEVTVYPKFVFHKALKGKAKTKRRDFPYMQQINKHIVVF